MRILLALLVVGCGDNVPRLADAPRDSAIDAAPDALGYPYKDCRAPVDCPTAAAPDCCIDCSPGGACDSSHCGVVTSNFCDLPLCDPLASAPCRNRAGTAGTCREEPLGINQAIRVWVCR